MSEPRKLWIPGPVGRLDAVLRVAADPIAGAIVAHPHPLHGGSLDNAVVFHADRELHRLGLTTLRFNFRGVGSSEGVHDEGRGEVRDLQDALHWVRGTVGGRPLLVVGYSFGSWCGLRVAARDPNVVGAIALGLPVLKYDFRDAVAELRKPLVVVQGSEDEFGRPDDVRAVLAGGDPVGSLVTLKDAPHLFPGRAQEVGRAVAAAARDLLDAGR